MGRLREVEDPLWYCPFFTKLKRDGRRRAISCEGGSRLVFEDPEACRVYAETYCCGKGYEGCAVAKTRIRFWEGAEHG